MVGEVKVYWWSQRATAICSFVLCELYYGPLYLIFLSVFIIIIPNSDRPKIICWNNQACVAKQNTFFTQVDQLLIWLNFPTLLMNFKEFLSYIPCVCQPWTPGLVFQCRQAGGCRNGAAPPESSRPWLELSGPWSGQEHSSCSEAASADSQL